MTENTATNNTLTVYYDGACPLCTIEIAHYKRQKGAEQLAFVDASKTTDLGTDLTQNQAMSRFHVRDADGTLSSGAAGFTKVWAVLPRWRWVARLASIPGITPCLELLYRGFLPVRPGLSRLVNRLKRT